MARVGVVHRSANALTARYDLPSVYFMNEHNVVTKNQLVTELTRSPHGKLEEYIPLARQAAIQEPEFLSHMIAYNEQKGQIRDSKVALPVISLTTAGFPADFRSNSLAHLALLSPRDFLRAMRFVKATTSMGGAGKSLTKLVTRYLRAREAKYTWWERQAVQHRASIKELYSLYHVKPGSENANIVLYGRDFNKVKQPYPRGSIFASIAQLKHMSAAEAAGTIMERRIPFMVAIGALGANAKDPSLVLALIERMSPTELVTNSKMLERLGVTTVPALRAAYAEALEKAGTKKTAASRTATFKATVAAAAFEEPEDERSPIQEKLRALQERQITRHKAEHGIDGDWLVLGDKSGSMTPAIEASRLVAATLAKLVKGQVELVFFDTAPRRIVATGKSYDQLVTETAFVKAVGGTSIGCGLQWALDAKREFGGIVIVSDGCENTLPLFARVYAEYEARYGYRPVVYWYRCQGSEPEIHAQNWINMMKAAGIDLQTFDIRGGTDHYALTNLASTMRLNRYSLLEEIMDTPLLDLDAILPQVVAA